MTFYKAQELLVHRIARVIHHTASVECRAALADALLSCDATPSLSDKEALCGEALFDALTAMDPNLSALVAAS